MSAFVFPLFFFFFNDTATTEIYTLSLHDALPICFSASGGRVGGELAVAKSPRNEGEPSVALDNRSEEHTSELQSHVNLVCRLLLEKKKKKKKKDKRSQYQKQQARDEESSRIVVRL